MRLSKLSIALLIVLALPLSNTATWAQADAKLTEIQRLFKLGQYASALGKADAHIFAKPRDPQGRFMKGLILAEMKRTNDAILVFKKLTEDFPELPEPYNNLAVLYAQEMQYDKARQALEAAIKTHPSYSVAHENLGDVYSKLASQAYGKALQIDSNNPVAQNKLALIRDLISVTARQSSRPPEPDKADSEPLQLDAADPVKPLAVPSPPPVVATPPAPASRAATAVPAALPGTPPSGAAPTAKPPAPQVSQPTVPSTSQPAFQPTVQAPMQAPVQAPMQAPMHAAVQPAVQPGLQPISPAVSTAPAAPLPHAPSANKAAPPDDAAMAVRAWAAAWSKKDVTNYLASYAPDFVPPGGLTRKAWEAERTARLTKPGAIEVGLEKIAVTLQGGDKATVRFRQNYRSANLKTTASKALLLIRSNNRWLIREERVN